MKKIAFFDIDGTLTSEIDGSIPQSTIDSIRKARENGHLMYINTGRCYSIIEEKFHEIGFDGFVCGCGTNIYCDGKEVMYTPSTHEITMEILEAARANDLDFFFESKNGTAFDSTRRLKDPEAIALYNSLMEGPYHVIEDIYDPNYSFDKFVIWYQEESQLTAFRKVSDKYFDCIDRGGNFRELVPHGCSKASGLQYVLDYYNISKENAYALGDSNNDLAMLTYLPNSISMGNASPKELFEIVSYVTTNASNNGIKNALEHFGFI